MCCSARRYLVLGTVHKKCHKLWWLKIVFLILFKSYLNKWSAKTFKTCWWKRCLTSICKQSLLWWQDGVLIYYSSEWIHLINAIDTSSRRENKMFKVSCQVLSLWKVLFELDYKFLITFEIHHQVSVIQNIQSSREKSTLYIYTALPHQMAKLQQ